MLFYTMGNDIVRLLKMGHYKGRALLRFVSTLDFWVAIILVFFPWYSQYLADLLISALKADLTEEARKLVYSVARIGSIPIAIQSFLRISREFMLSRYQIVGRDYMREAIRQAITFLMDQYGWQGSCRVTVFVPGETKGKDSPTLKFYDRISSGIGPTQSASKLFFSKGQGIPGKAWANAWSGGDHFSFIDALHIGNVPEHVLQDKKEIRKLFKEEFGITDDTIYEVLGENKYKIRSYMAIGILGMFQKLVCVICIDSEEANKFVDFEQLKSIKKAHLTSEEGMAIITGEGNIDDSSLATLPMPKIVADFLQQARKKVKDTNEWKETSDMIKGITCIATMSQSKDIVVHAPAFLFGIMWVMKQLRDFFLIEGKV
jgi:hypothetical protein